MAFKPVRLVHPKTGVVVTATTAVDHTNFRFRDGYVPADSARTLIKAEDGESKYPKLVEGLKKVDEIEAEEKQASEPEVESEPDEKPASKPAAKTAAGSKASTAKSGTDAEGNQVGVN